MMNSKFEDIVFACIEDRDIVSRKAHYTWARRCGIDLLLKLVILFLNSIGMRSTGCDCIFVDEVNNSNMRNNLGRTAEEIKGQEAVFLSFYSRKVNHLKVGYCWPILATIRLLTSSVFAVVSFIGSSDKTNLALSRILVKNMQSYLQRLPSSTSFILMTDHHFYSTVIAMSGLGKTVVLQHGLIQDVRFFSPVRADYLYTWSGKSAKLAADEKAVVSGTYKFGINGDYLKQKTRNLKEARNVLLLLSTSVSVSQIIDRISPIIRLKEEYGFDLGIKTHPGSLFSIKDLQRAVGNCTDIKLYKEEFIEDIQFDFAFIEQSTAVIDVACLGIPFIIIDETPKSYFSSYIGLLPIACTESELLDLAVNFNAEKYTSAYIELLNNEICYGSCRIKELLMCHSGDTSV